MRIVRRATVAHAGVELAVGPEHQVATVVVRVRLRDPDQLARRGLVDDVRIGLRHLVLDDVRRPVLGRVVDVELAVVREARMKREAEQALLVAGRQPVDREERPRRHLAVLDHADRRRAARPRTTGGARLPERRPATRADRARAPPRATRPSRQPRAAPRTARWRPAGTPVTGAGTAGAAGAAGAAGGCAGSTDRLQPEPTKPATTAAWANQIRRIRGRVVPRARRVSEPTGYPSVLRKPMLLASSLAAKSRSHAKWLI